MFSQPFQWLMVAATFILIALSGCVKEEVESCHECDVRTEIITDGVSSGHIYTEEIFCMPEEEAHNIHLSTFTFDSTNADGNQVRGKVYHCKK